MAEVNAAEVEAKAEAAFNAGFGVTPPAAAEKVVVEEPVVEPAKPDAAAAAAPAPVPKPEYVRLTKQEWDNTKAAAGKVSTLESQVAKLMGSLPKAEQIAQQVLERVKAETPAGLAVDVTDEDFAELQADFPELAKSTRTAVERILKKANVKGTGPAQQPADAAKSPAPPVDINRAVENALLEREANELAEVYPDWADIVGKPVAAGQPVRDTAFRAWLATQEPAYQTKVGETRSPAVVQAAIDKFRASQAQPPSASPSPRPDRAAARRAVIEDAVTPRAEGNLPPLNPPQTAEEAFGNGFKAVKSH